MSSPLLPSSLPWFYLTTVSTGPVSYLDLQNLVASGLISDSTLVWRFGWNEWIPWNRAQLDQDLGENGHVEKEMENEWGKKEEERDEEGRQWGREERNEEIRERRKRLDEGKNEMQNEIAFLANRNGNEVRSSQDVNQAMEYKYINHECQKVGPVSKAQLKFLFRNGELNGQTQGWCKGMTEWKELCELPGLNDVFPKIDVIAVLAGDDVDLDNLAMHEDQGQAPRNGAKSKLHAGVYEKNPDESGEEIEDEEDNGNDSVKKKKKKRVNHFRDLKQHQSIYLTKLPLDVREEEICDFCKKCGVILEDPNTGLPVVFVFKNEKGEIRGDASVTFLQPESVDLAVQLLDDSLLRVNLRPVHVERADWIFINKSIQLLKKLSPASSSVDHVRKKRKIASQLKQLDWKDTDDEFFSSDEDAHKQKGGKKIVIIKNVFDPSEAISSNFYANLEEELALAISKKCGPIEKFTVFEGNPLGVVAVRFKRHSSAEKCLEEMQGFLFNNRQLECEYFDGKTNYKVERPKEVEIAEEEKRLEEFGKWLEEQDD